MDLFRELIYRRGREIEMWTDQQRYVGKTDEKIEDVMKCANSFATQNMIEIIHDRAYDWSYDTPTKVPPETSYTIVINFHVRCIWMIY